MTDLIQLAVFGFFSGMGGAYGAIIAGKTFAYFEKRAQQTKKHLEKKLNKNGNRKNGEE